MKQETGLTKNQILSELSRSPHGKLEEYVPVGTQAAQKEPEFLAHLIAWDHMKGQVRDAKVALPIIALSGTNEPEFVENALAHLSELGPRELLKAYRFLDKFRVPGLQRTIGRLIVAYLKQKETDKYWDYFALQHHKVLRELYSLVHYKGDGSHAWRILFKGERPAGSLFDVVARLGTMTPTEAAGTILERKIPFLIAQGALGKKAKEPELVQALIERMSPTELITNVKMLEALGVKTNPALKGAFEKAMEKASASRKNVLKTTRAVEAVQDEHLKSKLRGVADKQARNISVEGNWLVIGDKSGSLSIAIDVAKFVAGTLAKLVKGEVHLVWIDDDPRYMDVTGKSLDEIKEMTKHIRADGSTSLGCAVAWCEQNKKEIDGIAVVSDGGDNHHPLFHDAYKRYSKWADKEVPVYFYMVPGTDPPVLLNYCQHAGIDLSVFDLTGSVDYYSLPNLIATMRTNRYSLVDEIMATPLKKLKLNDVLKLRKEVRNVAAV
jgi:hypothetical protein